MRKIPKKCNQCGAPITWDEVSSSITCEFCGGKTYIRSKFVFIEKVKGSTYKRLAPVSKSLNNAGKVLLSKQNILSDNQIDHISNKTKQLFKNSYFKVLLFAAPIAVITHLIVNSIINDPIKKYEKLITSNCEYTLVGLIPEYVAKQRFKKCLNDLREVVRKQIEVANEEGTVVNAYEDHYNLTYPPFRSWGISPSQWSLPKNVKKLKKDRRFEELEVLLEVRCNLEIGGFKSSSSECTLYREGGTEEVIKEHRGGIPLLDLMRQDNIPKKKKE